MFGGYIGQFLPLTIESLTNLLDGGGNTLLQFIPDTGVTLGQFLYFDQSQTMYVSGDGAGNTTITGGPTFTLSPTGHTGSSASLIYNNPSGSFSSGTGTGVSNSFFATVSGSANVTGVVSNLIVSGSSTGKQYIHQFQYGNATKSVIYKDGSAVGVSFSANQLLFVDSTNGNDPNGSGAWNNPFKTIAHATSVASSGNCIFLSPGTFNERVVLPAGVSLVGSGPGVTTVQYTSNTPDGIVLIPGTGSYVGELTVSRPHASGGAPGAPIGFNLGNNSAAQNASFFNVVFSGDFDVVYCFENTLPAYTAEGNWISGTTYSANQWVLYGATPYLCTTGLTSTTIPPQDTAHWTPMVYWTFRKCTLQSSWDCTNFAYPMFVDFFDCFFDQGPNQFGYNAIGSALQPANPSCRVRSIGCHIRQVATGMAGGGTAFNATSGGQIEVHDTSVVTINQDGTAVMNAIAVNGSSQIVKIGGGNSFDVSSYSQTGGGIIQGIASGAMFPTNSNPKDATAANRPPGVVGSLAVYSGGLYRCTNETTPTWVQITET